FRYPLCALVASIDGDPVGVLAESAGVWTFTYSAEWLRRPDRYPLSPSLPLVTEPVQDGCSLRPVQWYFDNLLPEEAQPRPAGGTGALSDAEPSVRIRAPPRQSLAAGAPERMSLAGAQHKLAVVVAGRQLLQPVGSAPSTHILK